jgi:hypothetical protein
VKTIDLHVHAKLSKSFPFDISAVYQMIWQAKRTGLDGFAIVEHLHADSYWGVYDRLRKSFAYDDGVFHVGRDFRLLSGAEVGISGGADLIALGTLDQIQTMNRGFARPATEGYKPTLQQALDVAQRAGMFVIGAHKFREKKELTKFPDGDLRRLDALECNGKDFHRDAQVQEAARRLGTPVVGGSDAHHWPQVGVKATVLPVSELTQAAVRNAVRNGHAIVRSLPHGPIAVRLAWAYKKIAKAQHARHVAREARRPAADICREIAASRARRGARG